MSIPRATSFWKARGEGARKLARIPRGFCACFIAVWTVRIENWRRHTWAEIKRLQGHEMKYLAIQKLGKGTLAMYVLTYILLVVLSKRGLFKLSSLSLVFVHTDVFINTRITMSLCLQHFGYQHWNWELKRRSIHEIWAHTPPRLFAHVVQRCIYDVKRRIARAFDKAFIFTYSSFRFLFCRFWW